MMRCASPQNLGVRVELFGIARLTTGRKAVMLRLPNRAQLQDVVVELAKECPTLVGKAIREDLSGLFDGYVMNVNGLSFVDRLDLPVSEGDAVLLISSEAGG